MGSYDDFIKYMKQEDKPNLSINVDETMAKKDQEQDNNIKNGKAEQKILGFIIWNTPIFNVGGDVLDEEHFYYEEHQLIYKAIRELYKGDNDINIEAIKAKLGSQVDVEYLQKLADLGRLVHQPKHEIRQVIGYSAFRKFDDVSAEMQDMIAKKDCYDISSKVSKLQNILEDARPNQLQKKKGNGVLIDEIWSDLDNMMKGVSTPFVSTGFKQIDDEIGGFANQNLIILAARPGMGKTALAMQIAYNMVKQGKPVGFYSLEMSAKELFKRLLSLMAGIDSFRINTGKLRNSVEDDEVGRILEASQELKSLPLFIDDAPALSIATLATKARKLKEEKNIQALFVDYLGLLKGTTKKADFNRVQEITEISMGLKALAKELDIPVIALSQLSRAVENRENKRPQLSDLRDSGSIEQDADIVMFLFREGYYIGQKKPNKEKVEEMEIWKAQMQASSASAELNIAKNRAGQQVEILMRWEPSTTSFR